LEEKYSKINFCYLSKFSEKNNFSEEFFLNCVKKMFFDLKSWGPLKNFKSRSGSYSVLALSIYVKKQNKNLSGLSL
jgi:hypothetical protein